jgi:multidrug resistance efflux pump
MKKLIVRILILVVVLGAAWGGYRYYQQLSSQKQRQNIPVAKVRQGDVVIRAFTRGELRAIRSETLTAPNLMGTDQITQLATPGALAKEKDLIVEFDDSDVVSRIEDSQLNLDSYDQSIKKSEAELAIRNNQDQVDLLQQQYAVRTSELQVKQNPLLSQIDARKNLLNLDEAKQRLTQLEANIKARRDQSEAQLALLRQQRTTLAIQLRRDQDRLRQTRILATMSGLVSIRQNSFGGMRQFGAQVPDIRNGDQVQTGMAVADVLDVSELEIAAKVGELDRANLVEGQEALITLDAVPGKVVHAKIKTMSGTATANVMAGDPSKKFDVVFGVDMKEMLTAVGAKPQQIAEMLATAERNRSRPVNRTSLSSLGMAAGDAAGDPGNMQGAGFGFAQPGMDSAGGAAGSGQRGGGQRGARSGGSSDPSQPAGGGQRAARGGQDSGQPGGRGGQGGAQAGPGGGQGVAGGQGGGRGGQGGAQAGPGGGQGVAGGQGGGRGGQGGGGGRGGGGGLPSLAELEAAKLPAAPEESDSGLQVLLRPGLLADVEVIVEKLSNVIYVPTQAIFQKEGKSVVYVQNANRFEVRPVKVLKRSESTMVISEGVKPGEVIALSDPTVQKQNKQQAAPSGGGETPMSGAPAASKT